MADNINSYRGDAGLAFGSSTGGGLLGVFDMSRTMDASDRIALYNHQTDKDLWERANQEKDKLAKEAAANLAFKIGDWNPNDADIILNDISEINSAFVQDPNSSSVRIGADGKVQNAEGFKSFKDKQNRINYNIERANTRRAQTLATQAQIEAIKDEPTRKKAEEWLAAEKQRPINEDIRLYPDFEPYDINKDLASTFTDTKYTKIKRNPNDLEETDFVLTDFSKGLAGMNSLLLTNPKKMDQAQAQLGTLQKLIDDPLVRDENNKVDEVALAKASPMGASIIDMVKKSNDYIDMYNLQVDAGNITGSKIDKVDLSDGLNDINEYITMVASSKLGSQSKTQVRETDNAIQNAGLDIQRQRLAMDKEEFALKLQDYKDGKDKEAAVGELPNQAFWILGDAARKNMERPGYTGAPADVTNAQFQNAFAIKTNGKQKVVSEDEDGTKTTIEISGDIKPERVTVGYLDGKKDGPNDFVVRAVYVDPKTNRTFTRTYNADEAYTQMSSITGEAKDVAPLSKAQTAFRLSKNGIHSKTAKWSEINKFYQRQQSGDANTPVSNESTPSSGSTISIRGKAYNRGDVERKARERNLTIDEYLQKVNK